MPKVGENITAHKNTVQVEGHCSRRLDLKAVQHAAGSGGLPALNRCPALERRPSLFDSHPLPLPSRSAANQVWTPAATSAHFGGCQPREGRDLWPAGRCMRENGRERLVGRSAVPIYRTARYSAP